MSIADNIKYIRQRAGLTQEEFGKIADVSYMAVSQWENGRAVPRMGAVQRIADHFGLTNSQVIDGIDAKPRVIPDNAIFPVKSEYASRPLLGRVHAGNAQEPDILEEEMPLPKPVADRHPNSYFLRVEGDCMNNIYPEGCHILIDPDIEPTNGSIAVVSINGEDYVMRRLFRGANVLVLSPDSTNSTHEDIVINNSDDYEIKFVGTVVWFQAAKELE